MGDFHLRPSPGDLAHEAAEPKTARQDKPKIYFGYAAGVGKTKLYP